jgi:hypothetical protein
MEKIKIQLSLNERLSAVDVAWNVQSLQDIMENGKMMLNGCVNIRQMLSLINT